jgi:hypothetical protein
MSLKVKLADAVAMFKEMDYEGVDEWGAVRMLKKIQAIPKQKGDSEPNTKASKKLLKSILEELKGDADIVIDDPDAEEEAAPAKKEKGAKEEKATKKAAKAAPEPEEDDEEEDEEEDDSDDEEEEDEADEDDDEEEEDEDSVKVAKKKKASKKGGKANFQKAGGEGGPGVIGSIVEFLQEGTEDKPLSRADILKKLVKRFPERGEDAMKKTVNVQVPNRIAKDKGLDVIKVEKDGKPFFYVNPDKVEKKEKASKKK